MRTYPDFSTSTVLVVGDVMLDRYCWGVVERISPEAPIPIVRVNKKTETLGGAGNVALNLVGLGCRCFLVGVCGNDFPGNVLISLLKNCKIRDNLIKSETRPTTTKTRVIGQGQQLLRLDDEETGRLPDDIYGRLYEKFDEMLPKSSAVIISDYGKGIYETDLAFNIISRCRQKNIPVFVDPKGSHWDKYKGATCITPNTSEFKLIAPGMTHDDSSFSLEAQRVIEKLELTHLLITRGAEGLSLFTRNQPAKHISSIAKEVYDVSGAGDTVIATLALAVGSGLDIASAAALANTAAGIVVGKVGTQPISGYELESAFYGKDLDGLNKIFTLRQGNEIIGKWRSEGKRIVFTNGCFDILHIGHIKLLHAAKGEGDKLVVGLNSDASIKKLKGASRPIMGEEERSAILSSLKCVDLVVLFGEETPIELIKTIQPDVIVKGGDYTPETVVGHEIVEKNGGKVVIFPLIKGISTSQVIDQVINHVINQVKNNQEK